MPPSVCKCAVVQKSLPKGAVSPLAPFEVNFRPARRAATLPLSQKDTNGNRSRSLLM